MEKVYIRLSTLLTASAPPASEGCVCA